MEYISLENYRKATKKRSKYNNSEAIVDSHKFDSTAEANYYIYLKNDPRVWEIELQPVFVLQEAFTHPITCKKYRAITYRADFRVTMTGTGQIRIIDIKGMRTEVFSIKEKMFSCKYPDLILEIIKA